MCLRALAGLIGWPQDTQKILRSASSLSPSVFCRNQTRLFTLLIHNCQHDAHASNSVPHRLLTRIRMAFWLAAPKSLLSPSQNTYVLIQCHFLPLGSVDQVIQFDDLAVQFSDLLLGFFHLASHLLQGFLVIFFSNTGTTLPLLNTLGQELKQTTGKGIKIRVIKRKNEIRL